MVTPDPAAAAMFSELFGEIGIAVKMNVDGTSVVKELGLAKFEALVLDLDSISGALFVIKSLRESRPNKNAVVFAVTTDAVSRQRAIEQGANYTFERPPTLSHVKQVLHTAYEFMVRERRQYFRCAVELRVRLRRSSGTELECATINLSRDGMAVNVGSALQVAEPIGIDFVVPGTDLAVSAEGLVVWDDKHGKAGISFTCKSLITQTRLAAWLDSYFYRELDPGVRR